MKRKGKWWKIILIVLAALIILILSAMRGEIDFKESFTRRAALLKGLDVSVMEDIARNLPLNEGLERMMKILRRVGYKTAILSGGFTYFGKYLQQKFGFDYVYANELEVENGRSRHRLPRQTEGQGYRRAEPLDRRHGRHPLFLGLKRLPDRRVGPQPPPAQ